MSFATSNSTGLAAVYFNYWLQSMRKTEHFQFNVFSLNAARMKTQTADNEFFKGSINVVHSTAFGDVKCRTLQNRARPHLLQTISKEI